MNITPQQLEFIAKWNAGTRAEMSPELRKEIYGYVGLYNKWDWSKIDWRKIEKRVFNLQKRIFKATKDGQLSKAKSLIKLLNRSSSAILMAARKVTQDNQGKRNGKKRPLSIPTQEDRVIQHVVKSALEPHYEAKFEDCSFSFRPAISAHDAIESIFNATRKPKWVLDANIKGCFDNIDHDFLLEQIDDYWKPFIKEWLKAGYIVRYADDFVVMHDDKDVIIKAQEIIQNWLKARGLELSMEKTKIVHTTEGFDFLGFNIKHHKNDKIKGFYKRKLLKSKEGRRRVEKDLILQIKPSKEKIQQHKESIVHIFQNSKAISQDELIQRLNPVIKGWANYYRYVVSSPTFASLNHYLWQKLWRWSQRRHPTKGKGWIREKYFSYTRNRSWDFKTEEKAIHWYNYSKVKTGSYAKVRKDKSYYDGDSIY